MQEIGVMHERRYRMSVEIDFKKYLGFVFKNVTLYIFSVSWVYSETSIVLQTHDTRT